MLNITPRLTEIDTQNSRDAIPKGEYKRFTYFQKAITPSTGGKRCYFPMPVEEHFTPSLPLSTRRASLQPSLRSQVDEKISLQFTQRTNSASRVTTQPRIHPSFESPLGPIKASKFTGYTTRSELHRWAPM